MNKINKIKNNGTEKDFATYQLKIPNELWKQFKIKMLTDDRKGLGNTILEIMEGYVSK